MQKQKKLELPIAYPPQGQLTPTDQRDIPGHMASCSTYKPEGRRGKGGNVWSNGISLPKSPLHMMEAVLRMAESELPDHEKC